MAVALSHAPALADDQTVAGRTPETNITAGLVVTEQFNDNIFATRALKVPDGITVVSPAVNMRLRDASGELNFGGTAEFSFYAAHPDENTQDFELYANGRYRAGADVLLLAGAGYDRKHDDRSSPDDALGQRPTIYYVARAYAAAQTKSGATTLKLGATFDNLDFEDASGFAGTINNDDRDRNVVTAGFRVSYDVTRRDQVYAALSYDGRHYRTDFDDAGFARDSDGVRASVGIRSKLTDALDGEVYGGWIYQSYDDARFDNVSSPDFGGRLIWTPLAGLSVEANAERSLMETTLVGASGYLQTHASLSFVQWIRPDVRLNGGVGYYDNEYQDLARRDNIFEAWAGIRRYVSPHVYLGVNYAFTSRDSTDIRESYDQSVVMVRLGRTQDPAYTASEISDPSVPERRHTGAYVGVKTGLVTTETKLEGPRGNGGDLQADFGDHGIVGGGFLGYGMAIGKWHLALEGDFTFGSADWDHSRSPGGRVFSVDRKESYGLSAIVGRNLNGGSLFYGRAGAVYQHFDTAYETVGNAFASSESKIGLRLGIGGSVPLSSQLSLRMEYEYTTFGDYKLGPPREPDTFANDESGVWLGLAYAFHPSLPADVPAFDVQWSGFYWGGQIGRSALSSLTTGDREPPSILVADFSDTGATGGLFAGYGLSFNRLYLAAEIEAELSDVSWDHERDPTGRSFSLEKKGGLGAGLRVGYIVNNAALLYGRVGIVQSYFDIDFDRGLNAVHKDATEIALRYGFGMELPATPHMAIRLDYTFTDYGTLRLTAPPVGDVETYKTTESLFRLGSVIRY